jgi:hypothetical protein
MFILKGSSNIWVNAVGLLLRFFSGHVSASFVIKLAGCFRLLLPAVLSAESVDSGGIVCGLWLLAGRFPLAYRLDVASRTLRSQSLVLRHGFASLLPGEIAVATVDWFIVGPRDSVFSAGFIKVGSRFADGFGIVTIVSLALRLFRRDRVGHWDVFGSRGRRFYGRGRLV